MLYGRFLYNGKVIEGYIEDGFVFRKNRKVPIENLKILPPSTPTKIVCLGLNFKSHAEELNMDIPEEPVIFLKPVSAIIGHKDKIVYPQSTKLLHYEGEIAVIIKSTCRDVSIGDAKKYIHGITAFNDVTARDLQKKDGQWTRAKSFDTFAPTGPFIITEFQPYDISLNTFLNGVVVQSGVSSDMIFDIYYVVSFISKIMTLYPGDIISTGTPPGVGELKRNDVIKIKVNNIELENTVI